MRKLLIAALLAAAGYLLVPSLRPNNAKCAWCARLFYAGGEKYVMCKACRRAQTAEGARNYFSAPPDLPFLPDFTTKINGPLPADTIER